MTETKARRTRARRLLEVQSQLRQIEEWRLVRLDQQLHALADEEREVFHALDKDEALGGLFVDVRARRLKSIAEETHRVTQARKRQSGRVLDRSRREKGAERLSQRATHEAAAANDKTVLDEIIERCAAAGSPQASDKFGKP